MRAPGGFRQAQSGRHSAATAGNSQAGKGMDDAIKKSQTTACGRGGVWTLPAGQGLPGHVQWEALCRGPAPCQAAPLGAGGDGCQMGPVSAESAASRRERPAVRREIGHAGNCLLPTCAAASADVHYSQETAKKSQELYRESCGQWVMLCYYIAIASTAHRCSGRAAAAARPVSSEGHDPRKGNRSVQGSEANGQ